MNDPADPIVAAYKRDFDRLIASSVALVGAVVIVFFAVGCWVVFS